MYKKEVQMSEEWSREARMVKVQKCNNNNKTMVVRHEGVFWGQSIFECSFCKRQFRSAQALGGHMNVHRRERAKLASSLHQNLPIEDPKLKSHSSHIAHGRQMRKRGLDLDLDLNLNIALLRDHHNEEDLDLELRLGFSS